MSKALSRVRALLTEIDSIQTHGRKSPSGEPLMKAVQSESITQPTPSEPKPESNVLPLNSRVSEAPPQSAAPEGKVFIQLTGNIAIQLQLEHTDEIVEVRQVGESIEIRFTDGKAIHLPIKSMA
jgi:hypothetical protein